MTRKKTLTTFRSRFMMIYGLTTLISLVLIITSGVVVYRITNTYETLSNFIEPVKFNLLSFNSEANQLAAHQQAHIYSGSTESKEYVAYVSARMNSRIKVLADYADTLNDATLVLGTDGLAAELKALMAATSQMESSDAEEQANIVKNRMMPAVVKISTLTKEMNTYLFEKHLGGFTAIMSWLKEIQLMALLGFILLMAGFYYIVHKTRKFIVAQLLILDLEIEELSNGNLPEALPNPENELSSISNSVNRLLKNLEGVKEFSQSVGRGDFDSDITVFDNQGDLGSALAAMRQSLKEVSAEDKKRDWVNVGLAQFLNIIRNADENSENLSQQVLASLVKYVNANQGGLFLAEQAGGQTQLKLEAAFAYNRKKYQDKVLLPGQGLVGQAYLERDKIYLRQVPQNYVSITSGLGDATPRTLFIQPLMVNEEVIGVLELASFHDFEPHVQEFIQKVSESVASAISAAQNNLRNQQILTQTQGLTEQLRAQEEELRQNTEELQATQEEMARRIRELEKENNLLKGIKLA
ncbi:MAG: GAF domain-containing protein [Bacteroidetes bacterium]|nr:GAF domain-containing protein [Bacteroidota bacterium]